MRRAFLERERANLTEFQFKNFSHQFVLFVLFVGYLRTPLAFSEGVVLG